MRLPTLLFTALAVLPIRSVAIGQEETSQEEVQLTKPAETVDEVVSRLESVKANAKEEYRETVDEAETQAIDNLKQLAKQAVANGDLAAASDRWGAVLRIDPKNQAAKEFFRTIGRSDILGEKKALVNVRDDLLGTWKWRSGTEITFRRDGSKVSKSLDGAIRKGRWEYDTESQSVLLVNSKGEVTDRVEITRNGRMLEGMNRKAGHVWGVKIK